MLVVSFFARHNWKAHPRPLKAFCFVNSTCGRPMVRRCRQLAVHMRRLGGCGAGNRHADWSQDVMSKEHVIGGVPFFDSPRADFNPVSLLGNSTTPAFKSTLAVIKNWNPGHWCSFGGSLEPSKSSNLRHCRGLRENAKSKNTKRCQLDEAMILRGRLGKFHAFVCFQFSTSMPESSKLEPKPCRSGRIAAASQRCLLAT